MALYDYRIREGWVGRCGVGGAGMGSGYSRLEDTTDDREASGATFSVCFSSGWPVEIPDDVFLQAS